MNFISDPITFIAHLLEKLLLGWGVSQNVATFILSLVGVAVLATGAMLWCILLIWYERKIAGRFQDRFGPNRVGPFGIFQPVADMLKIFTKEYIIPDGADRIPYLLAPVLSVASVLLMWAVVPLAVTVFGVDLSVGALYVVAVGAIGELGIIMAGWSSNNKYAMLGAFRAVAQLISYEVPMILALLVPVLLSGSMSMVGLVKAQEPWFIITAPLAALIFLIASIAESGRAPFDLLEAESEIVAGFNIEYSGLMFGMFFVGEFLHAFTAALIFATLFLGGWRGPGAEQFPILGFVYLFIKTGAVYFLTLTLRFSLPRFRIDQMMDINWKILTPVSLVLVCVTALLAKTMQSSPVLLRSLVLLIANLAILVVTGEILRRVGERRKQQLQRVVLPKVRQQTHPMV
jgi:NADH-quinone oxidoreductase subunit H